MASNWQSWPWQTCPGGVSSAVNPDLLPQGQFAWGYNIAVRGGKPHTRPVFIERPCGLPRGLHQCSSYFGIQDGMIVTSIGGSLLRIRIGENIFSWEPIPLSFRNSGLVKQAWMQQTVESLVIQDGQSDPIIYNGSTARRAGLLEVPRGRQMAYGNGRLWVAVDQNNLEAGDIRTENPGSELKFTEVTYFNGGGKIYFPRGITGMQFIPVTGAADFGTLVIYGNDYCESIRADVTSRDQWGMPGFITNVFRDIGAAGQWGIVQVNQDLYWRDSRGNIRSLANSISTNRSPGSTPISREVSRLVAYDSEQLLPFCSAIYFDNRLLMTSSPYLNISGGVSFKSLVSLDFSPISTMQIKAPPAYDGAWTGIPGMAQLITGIFNGQNRAFCISSDEEGVNRLWEMMTEDVGVNDLALSCGSGIITESPIECFIEYPQVNFQVEKNRKRLERLDVWLANIDGPLSIRAYWRMDNAQQWLEWDGTAVCAKTTDAATNSPHVWKNLLPEQRPQIKSFTIPDSVDKVTNFQSDVGFDAQVRLVWVGKCQIEKVMLHASLLDDPDYADKDWLSVECIENNITDNEINYQIPTSGGFLSVTNVDGFAPDPINSSGVAGDDIEPSSYTYLLRNFSEIPFDWTASTDADWLMIDNSYGSLEPGASVEVTVTVDADSKENGDYSGHVTFTNSTNMCGDTTVDASLEVTGDFPGDTMIFAQYDGPFVYPACMGTFENRYYKTETATGDNYVRYAPIAGSIQNRSCIVGLGDLYATGVISTIWSGTASHDMACNATGGISVYLNRQGSIAAYDFPGTPGTQTQRIGSSVDAAFAAFDNPAMPPGFTFISETYGRFASHDGSTSTRLWRSPSPTLGYLAGQYGGIYDSIWCQGHEMKAVMSDPVTVDDLGTPVARSGGVGTPAQTQRMDSFNGTTRTNSGNMSRGIFMVPVVAGHTSLAGEFTFNVVPDVGAPYTLMVINDYPITGLIVNGYVDYPMIENATVTLVKWVYSYQKSVAEDFSSYVETGSIVMLPPSGSWDAPIAFDAPPPNTDCWDDFSDYPGYAQVELTTIPTGYRWNGIGKTSMVDYTGAQDDFEGYPVGSIIGLAQGIGWSGSGSTTVGDYTQCYDDFESYAVGAITTLDFAGVNNKWNASGTFLTYYYTAAWDDFESYSTGSIFVFDFTSTDNEWNGNGVAA